MPTQPNINEGLPQNLRRLVVAIMLGAFMVALDMTMVNVALHTLELDFHASVTTIQWVSTGYLLALAMVIPVTGWAVERFGARNSWVAALLVFIGGSILCGLAWSSGSLIAFRVVQGIGGGMLLPLAQMILAQAAGPQRLGLYGRYAISQVALSSISFNARVLALFLARATSRGMGRREDHDAYRT
jgi:MFS family permease